MCGYFGEGGLLFRRTNIKDICCVVKITGFRHKYYVRRDAPPAGICVYEGVCVWGGEAPIGSYCVHCKENMCVATLQELEKLQIEIIIVTTIIMIIVIIIVIIIILNAGSRALSP